MKKSFEEICDDIITIDLLLHDAHLDLHNEKFENIEVKLKLTLEMVRQLIQDWKR